MSEEQHRKPLIVLKYRHSIGRPPGSIMADEGFKSAWQKMLDRGTVTAGAPLAFVRNPEGTQVRDAWSTVKPGANVRVSSDGSMLLAEVPGIPYVADGEVGVLDHIEIVGNISSVTGDVEFPGDLSVRGSVEAGRRISAGGSIIISGTLCGSAIARGKIVVGGGINAPGHIIESGGGVVCRFCENSTIRSDGQVTVGEACLHSTIESEESIVVGDGTGRIVGGLTRAARGVKAGTVGTPMGTLTIVEVGISPKLRREHARLQSELARLKKELETVERNSRGPASRPYDHLRITRVRKFLQDQAQELSEQLKHFEDMLGRSAPGYFWARSVLPGTRLVFGLSVQEFTAPADNLRLGVIPDETH